jgi:hypothetical protein
MATLLRYVAACAAVVLSCCACGDTHPPRIDRSVVYVRYLGHGRSDVWLAHLAGGKRLIARRADRPILSPDGQWIAYAKCIAADYCDDVYLASTDGAERRLLARRIEAGAWTPFIRLRRVAVRPLRRRSARAGRRSKIREARAVAARRNQSVCRRGCARRRCALRRLADVERLTTAVAADRDTHGMPPALLPTWMKVPANVDFCVKARRGPPAYKAGAKGCGDYRARAACCGNYGEGSCGMCTG